MSMSEAPNIVLTDYAVAGALDDVYLPHRSPDLNPMETVPRGMQFYKPLLHGRIPVKAPETGFNLIYADPPWNYRQKVKNGVVCYDTMSIEDLKAMPISQIAAGDCALAMWITGPLLQEGLDVIKAWGFEFKGILFCWCKTYKPKASESGRVTAKPFFGCGSYTRANCELLLLAVRGKKVASMIKARAHLGSRGVSQVVITEENEIELPEATLMAVPHQGHSVKPGIFTKKLDVLFGDYVDKEGVNIKCEKLELFARTSQTPDWYYFGNEVVKYMGRSKEALRLELKKEKRVENELKRARRALNKASRSEKRVHD